jgi:polyisoprenoid-binding protein YceI
MRSVSQVTLGPGSMNADPTPARPRACKDHSAVPTAANGWALVRWLALGPSNNVGGQTTAVTGTIVISGHTVTAASLQINLTTVKVSGKIQPQFATSLGTRDHPLATFTLAGPVTLSHAFTAGRTLTATAAGQLTMNGSARAVTVTLTARRNGPLLQTAGFIPVSLGRRASAGQPEPGRSARWPPTGTRSSCSSCTGNSQRFRSRLAQWQCGPGRTVHHALLRRSL